MKKLLFLLMLYSSFSIAQDRIYFDSAWAVTTKEKAVFYRETEQKGNLTLLKDYYKNGTLQMEGLASDTTPGEEIFDGKVTWYYPNGKVQSFTHYKNGRFVGESKGYDEDGKINTDLVYDADSDYTGKMYTNKNDKNGVYYNSVGDYKKSNLVKTIIYDENINGIRTETDYAELFNPKETRYYDEQGKQIGTLKYTSEYTYADNSTLVDFYYNPMRIASITKYAKGEDVAEKKEYFQNGKLKSQYKATGESAKASFYNKNGVKISDLQYKKIKDEYSYGGSDKYISPYEGKHVTYQYAEGKTDEILQETEYQKGKPVSEKTYREDGSPETYKEFEETEESYYGYANIKKVTYYNENGLVKSVVDYRDGVPYNGISYDDGEAEYKDGLLVNEKRFDDKKNLRLERKPSINGNSEVKIYDENKKLKYFYTYNNTNDNYSFTGTVKSFITGKEQTATFENGIITKGKLRYDADSSGNKFELERNGERVIKRNYDDKNVLIKETTEKIDPENYYGESRFYEELLTSFNSVGVVQAVSEIPAPPMPPKK